MKKIILEWRSSSEAYTNKSYTDPAAPTSHWTIHMRCTYRDRYIAAAHRVLV